MQQKFVMSADGDGWAATVKAFEVGDVWRTVPQDSKFPAILGLLKRSRPGRVRGFRKRKFMSYSQTSLLSRVTPALAAYSKALVRAVEGFGADSARAIVRGLDTIRAVAARCAY